MSGVTVRRVLQIPVDFEFNDVDREVESPARTQERADILARQLASTFLHGSNGKGTMGNVKVVIDRDAIRVGR